MHSVFIPEHGANGGARRAGWRRAFTFAALALLLAALVWPVSAGQQTAAPNAVVVGRLYGEDLAVQNAVSFESNFGFSTALLASGSDVTVRSGRAQIDLMRGGSVAICGPAHFTLLESGGAITLALDYGRVRPQLEAQVALTVYTPMIVATPVAIGTNPRDLTVGLNREGAMCTMTTRGAVRIEQQLSGQSLLVPQGGEISLNDGQLATLRSASGSCDCELLVTRNTSPKNLELSMPVPNPAARPRPATAPPPPRVEQPIYRVYLPPLTFDASAPDEPPDPDPAHIFLVREVQPLPLMNSGATGRADPRSSLGLRSSTGDRSGRSRCHAAEETEYFCALFRRHLRSQGSTLPGLRLRRRRQLAFFPGLPSPYAARSTAVLQSRQRLP